MLSPLIITCGITGDNNLKDANPGIPLTAAEQAQDALDAFNAGAAIVHVHRRTAANHTITSDDPDEYMEVNIAMRAKCADVIINNTSGGSKRKSADGVVSPPMAASVHAKPEIASLDAVNLIAGGSMQAQLPKINRNPEMLLSKEESESLVALMNSNGCKPEYMCYGIHEFMYMKEFVNTGLPGFEAPHWIQLVCTAQTTHGKIESICQAISNLPENSLSLLGVISGGDTQWGILATAIAMGAHVRVGFEDNLYVSSGKLAKSNAQLVEKIVRIAQDIGRPIATSAQARAMLKLGAPRPY